MNLNMAVSGNLHCYTDWKCIILFCFLFPVSNAGNAQDSINIIPHPVEVKIKTGSFQVNVKTTVLTDTGDDQLLKMAQEFTSRVFSATGFLLKIKSGFHLRNNSILFAKDTLSQIMHEGYRLKINDKGVTISAFDHAGLFYGKQTLYQLFPPGILSDKQNLQLPLAVPYCEIIDFPRYPFRGMHLDVCRHFFEIDFIKKYLDLLALHKMNRFHWHLTEDQGWRIEIKKYPKLTSVGSIRKESMTGFYDDQKFDGTPYGGYYTQEQIREIIQYAEDRFITVIPEIEMPGHALAALAAYPWLGCNPDTTFEVATGWGVFNEVFCPTEATFKFLEDVLTEVCDLFPGKYIHIGGDECPKISWRNSAFCQGLIASENLKDEHGLQSYFITRIEKFLLTKGKKIIGWDEILEGGLAPEATVMSWRGVNGGIAAAREHHQVIMSPGSHCYFDHYQSDPETEPIAIGGYTTVQKVYHFEPTPVDSLTAEQQTFIIGAQGNVWTEYITSRRHVEYMAFPRAAALAEVLWTPKKNREWNGFSKRLIHHFKRLDVLDVNYARSLYDVTATFGADTNQKTMIVTLGKGIESGIIKYTTDHTIPDKNALVYNEPIAISDHTVLKARLFYSENSGKVLTREIHMHKAVALPYTLNYQWKQYDGAGKYALTDGIFGVLNRYNTWVGFSGKDLDVVIDLQELKVVKSVSVRFYNKRRAWIYLPVSVTYAVSSDGINYRTVYNNEQINDPSPNSIVKLEANLNMEQVRFVKVLARTIGKCPLNSEGEGMDAWLFGDEIVVE